ncbi:unnamed protein product [Calypogeia fissa]
MEDDALVKKNTDCVYFLASPLTCKKGNDCEFRHSESARVNPRDCRYWLLGNCLNWDCPFRHPPLEGRPTVAAAAAPASGGTNKSRVPCYFFSQGYCAKGDKCPFLHVTPAVPKPPSTQRPVKVAPPVSAPEPNEKEKETAASNGVEATSAPVAASEPQPTEVRPAHTSGAQSKQKDMRTVSVSGATQNGVSRGRAEGPVVSSGLVGNRLRLRQVQPGDDRVQNGMEPDEWWEESSPGFDVLVDDGPEQSRYPDDPEFQSAGETGLDSGKVAAGNRGRGGRSMRMEDDIEQYDYDFPNPYDHTGNYDGGAPYDHGGYEYNAHDQQGGYDPSNSYDHPGHQRALAYSDRAVADEMIARERLGLPMDVDMRSGGGAHDQRTRIVKRRRPDGGQQHVFDNYGRRQRTEMPLDEYQHHQRQQEDQQKQHELHLRHQLFMQHGMRNNARRVQEKIGLEPGVIARRALHEIGASEGPVPVSERLPPRSMSKGRSMSEQSRGGTREADIHSRLSKATDGLGEAENRNFMDVEGNRKSEKEVKKDPSTFAGPKTLAQIRAEKRKGAAEEQPRSSEASNGFKKSVPASFQSKGSSGRTLSQQAASLPGPERVSHDGVSAEERKIKLDKVVGQELKKLPTFEGPKSLSAILKEKRRVESDGDSKSEEAIVDHFQRLSPPTSKVVTASRVETVSTEDSDIPDVQTEAGAGAGYAEVEDGEFLSDEDAVKGRRDKDSNVGESHSAGAVTDGSQVRATTDSLLQEDDAVIVPEAVEGGQEDMMVEEHGNGAGAEQNVEELHYTGGHEFEDDVRDDVEEDEPEEDGYGLDDDEEDDFAKKLGNFFS